MNKLTLLVLFLSVSASAAPLVEYDFSVLTGDRIAWTAGARAEVATWKNDPRKGKTYLLNGKTEAKAVSEVSPGDLSPIGVNLKYATSTAEGGDPEHNLNLSGWLRVGKKDAASITFPLSVAPNSRVMIASVTFSGWRNGEGAPDSIRIEYSLDGGSHWTIYDQPQLRLKKGAGTNASNIFRQDLSLEDGQSIVFRLIIDRDKEGTPLGNWHLTGLSIDGSVGAPLAAAPTITISPETTLIDSGQKISVTADPPETRLFYTLDGSLPDESSPAYTGPITLEKSASVRVIGIQKGARTAEKNHHFALRQPLGQPNLLVIAAPGIGHGDLQCQGNVNIATPALDSLAYDGIRFTQFTTTGSGDTASQYALLTGRVAARSEITDSLVAADGAGWKAEEWTLAEMLRASGHRTAFIGQWLLGAATGSHPLDQGFDHFYGLLADLSLHPSLCDDRKVVSEMPDPDKLLPQITAQARTFLEKNADSPFAIVYQIPHLNASGQSLAGPHGNRVEAVDATVKSLLETLDQLKLSNRTLVLFLSTSSASRSPDKDGGSNGLLRDGAGTSWEGGLRGPLIARLPGTLPAGQMNLATVWIPDLMPTLATLLDSDLSPDGQIIDGTPRPDVLTGTTTRTPADARAFGLRREDGKWSVTTVREGDWKLHRSVTTTDPDNNRSTQAGQLFNLDNDPEEHIDRAPFASARVQSLREIADQFTKSLESTKE